MEKITRILGTCSIIIGVLAATTTLLFLVKPIRFFLFAAMLSGLIGFLASNIYIFLNLRYKVSEKKVTPGTLGILLCSVPIIMILVVKALHHP
jgi:hypothetical protein